MAVTLGRDYAIVRKTGWWFETGLGHGTGVMTRRTFFLFPTHTLVAGVTTRTTTDFTIGSQSPYDAIMQLAARPEITPDAFDQQLGAWAAQVQGPIRLDLATVKRIRLFTGWLRRSVVFSQKESGYEARAKGVRPTKQEMPAWVAILADNPIVERK